MKRFYTAAEVVENPAGFSVTLDGRAIKTPAKADLVIPTAAAAQLVADDWNAQGDAVDAAAMSYARFANTAIDRIADRRDAVIDEIAAYAGSDLVCYRADRPATLVARQADAWDPYVRFAATDYGADLKVTSGIIHVTQSEEALAKLRAPLEAMSDHMLSPFFSLTTGLGSLVLALASAKKPDDFEDVFATSQLDALFQEQEWGADHEAETARAALRADLEKALRYLVAARIL